MSRELPNLGAQWLEPSKRLRRRRLGQSILAGVTALSLCGIVATPALAAPEVAHQVTPGDTLFGSARQYGTSSAGPEAANHLPDSSSLGAGQTLAAPGSAPETPSRTVPDSLPATSLPTNGSSAHYPSFTITPDGVVTRSLSDVPPASPTPLPTPTLSGKAAPPVSSAPGTASILSAPYYSQFDSGVYAETNCGPTSLSMALGALKINADPMTLRRLANTQMGTSDPNSGTTWEALAYAANVERAAVSGLYQGTGYRSWSLNDLTSELSQGHPVLLLVRYRDLPGNAGSPFQSDHYVVALGFDKNGNLVYNDPAFRGGGGAGRTMTPQQLNLAWSNTSVGLVRTAMAISHAP